MAYSEEIPLYFVIVMCVFGLIATLSLATLLFVLVTFLAGLGMAVALDLDSKLRAAGQEIRALAGFLLSAFAIIVFVPCVAYMNDMPIPIFWPPLIVYMGGTVLYAARHGHRVLQDRPVIE